MQSIYAATLLAERCLKGELTRILAFGSSNTERRSPGMHWFDCLDLAIKQRYGRLHRCINTGVGGDTSRALLERFDQDAAFYHPHLVLITVGGNDCNPVKDIGIAEFERNLHTLHKRFSDMETRVVFQTYYAPINDDSERLRQFYKYSDIVRKVAAETESDLIDHLRRWTVLQEMHPSVYHPLMMDAFHLSPRGNLVLGMEIVRAFGLELQTNLQFWAEALCVQRLIDSSMPHS